jgi:hypothetical protein
MLGFLAFWRTCLSFSSACCNSPVSSSAGTTINLPASAIARTIVIVSIIVSNFKSIFSPNGFAYFLGLQISPFFFFFIYKKVQVNHIDAISQMIQIAKYIETDVPFRIFALGLFGHTNYPFQVYAQIRIVLHSILFVLFLHKKSILL